MTMINMRMRLLKTGVFIGLLASIPLVYGQKATEMFIPIGQSPGLSGKGTYLGKIAEVNGEDQTINAGGRTVKITDKTKIWLDQSKFNRANKVGEFADLRVGRRIEINYEDPDRKEVADWIKLEVTNQR